MPDGSERAPIAVDVAASINEVTAAEWNACARADNPFLSHAFLSALEDSGSVAPKAGWLPQHLLVRDEDGNLVACAPLYLKGHSYGEYVFDWGWADAFERAGGTYYPKLVSAIPFTPATSRRLLIHPDVDQARMTEVLGGALIEAMRQHKVSSVHVNFPTETEWSVLGEMGFLKRVGLQYHWENRGYQTFDDFLTDLSSRKRKSIRKERREALASGIDIHRLTGPDIEERHWDAFYNFYVDTSDRKWGSAYLNREFFRLLGDRLADRVMLVMAERDGMLVGGALNLIGDDTLYGRNWGCVADFKFLHFEACYYQAIDFAIERGLARVEAGAQGQHKIQRGYLPTFTYSNHFLESDNFRDAVDDFVGREHMQLKHEAAMLMEESPFRKTD
ncbi:MAG: N-acetyltransferase [Rhodospirillaceae bacterium]|jgi:uncharacterized protein|nr:N-acetyltransferase [Rhodospirillaceae bacterium]